jgi:threonine dehydrogenase-like Zn-dependent dehydrogenase
MDEPSVPPAMTALVWEAPCEMNLRSMPVPRIEPNEALVQVAYAGICGSELSGYLGHNALRVPPLVMGHEFSGRIAAFGGQVAAGSPSGRESSSLQPGRMVTVNPMVYCGTCDYCVRGKNHLCARRRLIGAHRPGAFATFVSVPARMVLPLPSGLSLRDGALTEPVACGVRIARLAGNVEGETVLVLGAGTIGLVTLQILIRHGTRQVFVADVEAERLATAATLGGATIDSRHHDVVKMVREATGGQGAALAVDAVGKAVTREQCISATRPGGSVILSGLHEENSSMPIADVIRREVTLHGSFCYTPADFQEAADLLSRRLISLDLGLVIAPLAEGGRWFERLSSGNPGKIAKVLLVP